MAAPRTAALIMSEVSLKSIGSLKVSQPAFIANTITNIEAAWSRKASRRASSPRRSTRMLLAAAFDVVSVKAA